MAATVVLSAFDVLQYPQGGGHFSAYLQYVYGLHAHGCDVWWLERLTSSGDRRADEATAAQLAGRLGDAGLPGKLIVYSGDSDREREWLTLDESQAEEVIGRADLLLNFSYGIDAELLARFARTALVDIDPGLLQLWIAGGDLHVAPHDLYFTTGDTVGSPEACFPSGGFPWIHIRPPVSLQQWRFANEQPSDVFTTISSWWSEEWVRDPVDGEWFENSKRTSFLQYLSLPEQVPVGLELALSIERAGDEQRALLESHGWSVRLARDVAATPRDYRSYIRGAAGEFSCAKPSCMRLRNGWVSDRTVCFLASGRPAVVQDTGPSESLDGGRGILRFSTLQGAAEALRSVRDEYESHRHAAREVAETYFDATRIAGIILDAAAGTSPRTAPAGVEPATPSS